MTMIFRLMVGVMLGVLLTTDVAVAGPDGICPGSAIYHLQDGVGACVTKTGQRHGTFVYYPKDGSHVRGEWRRGKRNAGWLIQNTEGVTVGWVVYRNGNGDHQAFYGSGYLREQGILSRGRQGVWLFFGEDGGLEGIVRYRNSRAMSGIVIGADGETDERKAIEAFLKRRGQTFRQVIDDEFDPPVPFPPQKNDPATQTEERIESLDVSPSVQADRPAETNAQSPQKPAKHSVSAPQKQRKMQAGSRNSTRYFAPRQMARRVRSSMPRAVKRALGKTPPGTIGAVVRVCTHSSGEVRTVEVLRSSGSSSADDQLALAFRKLVFKPGLTRPNSLLWGVPLSQPIEVS